MPLTNMRRIYLLALLIIAPNILGQQLIQSDETFEWGAGTLSFRRPLPPKISLSR